MGIESLLKSMAGTHSQSGVGAGSKAPKIPAMDSKTQKSYTELDTTLGKIQAKMRGIAEDKGASSELDNLAKKARKLQPLHKAIRDLKKAQDDWIKTLNEENSTIDDISKAYNKMAAAKEKQVQVANEMSGAFGRLKNVLGSFTKANVAMMAFTVIARDVVILSKQSNEAFDVMARQGQTLGKSFSEMAIAAKDYAYGLNMAAISGALAGHNGEESKKAFQELTRTFGGTGDVVAEVSSNFGDLATVAKFSGMSIGDAALYADKNFARLGKSMRASMEDIAQMGANTQNLNDMFGKGKVDTMAYAQTVSDLSFQSGNYNQNTKFLIESLNRELAVQFALGKSRDAAMDAAKKNLTKAGKANLVGAKRIGAKLQAEFDRGAFSGEAGKAAAKERFGAQYELVLQILKQGVGTGNNLIALHEIMANSTEMQGELTKEIRRDAAAGGNLGLASEVKTLPEQLVLKLEEGLIAEKIAEIRGAAKGDTERIEAARDALFPGIDKIEDPERKAEATEAVAQYIRALREDPELDGREAFAKTIEAVMPDAQDEGEDPVERFLHAVEAGGFIKMISAVNNLPAVIMGLPVAIAVAIAAEEAGKAGFLDMLSGKDPLDDGTEQVVIKTRRGPRNKYTDEQLAENRAKAKRKALAAQYDQGRRQLTLDGSMGTAETKGRTKEQFIKEHMADSDLSTSRGDALREEMGKKDPAELAKIAAEGGDRSHLAKAMIGKNKEAQFQDNLAKLAPPVSSRMPSSVDPLVGRELEGQFGTDGNDVIVRIPGAKGEFKKLAGETALEDSAHTPPEG